MAWTVTPVPLANLKRRKRHPNYAFVEQSIAEGAAYTLAGHGTAGYFIVASELSLVPGFVVELSLPELAVPEEYKELADEMAARSLGVLWFDSSDHDACDFAWRLELTLRSGPPLFAWTEGETAPELDDWRVEFARHDDESDMIRMLTTPPLDAGGQTREATIENLRGGCIATLKRYDDIGGAAVLSPLPGPYVGLTTVVMETYSRQPIETHERASRALELAFMRALGSRMASEGLTMVYSMARHTPTGYVEALQLNMEVAKHSFMGNFGTSWRSP